MSRPLGPPSAAGGDGPLFTEPRRQLLCQWLREKTCRDAGTLSVDRFAAGFNDRETIVLFVKEDVVAKFSQRLLARVLEGVQEVAEINEGARKELVAAGAVRLCASCFMKGSLQKQEPQQVVAVIERAFGAIWSLALSKQVRRGLATSSGSVVMLRALEANLGSPTVVYQGLGALRTLGTQTEVRARLRQAGAWDLTLRALQMYASDAGTTYLSLACLWTLSFDPSFSKDALVAERQERGQHGGTTVCALLVSSLTRHEDDQDVQHQGWGLVATLTFASTGNRVALVQAGIIPPLVRALCRHQHSPEVMKQACGSTWLLALGNPEAKAQLGDAVESLLGVLCHQPDLGKEAQHHAMGALHTIMRGTVVNAERAVRAGAWQTLIRAMQLCTSRETDEEALTLVTGALCLCGDAAANQPSFSEGTARLEGIEEAEACLAVLGALHSSLNSTTTGGSKSGHGHMELASSLLDIIRLLATRYGHVGEVLAHNGAMSLVALVLQRGMADGSIVFSALATLCALASRAAPSTTINAGDGGSTGLGQDLFRLLQQAMASHPAHRAIRVQALITGKAIAKVAGLRTRVLDKARGAEVVAELMGMADRALGDEWRQEAHPDLEVCRLCLSWLRTLASSDERLRLTILEKGMLRLLTKALTSTTSHSMVSDSLTSPSSSHRRHNPGKEQEEPPRHDDRSVIVSLLTECLSSVVAVTTGAGSPTGAPMIDSNEVSRLTSSMIDALNNVPPSDSALVQQASAVVNALLLLPPTLSPGAQLREVLPWLHSATAIEEAAAASAIRAIELSNSSRSTPYSPPTSIKEGQQHDARLYNITSPTPPVAFDPWLPPPPQVPSFHPQLPSFDGVGHPSQARWQVPAYSPCQPAEGSIVTDKEARPLSPVQGPPRSPAEASAPSPPQPSRERVRTGLLLVEEDEIKLCIVCWEVAATHAMVPCGHRCVCETHAKLIMTRGGESGGKGECPMCRQSVDTAVKIYL